MSTELNFNVKSELQTIFQIEINQELKRINTGSTRIYKLRGQIHLRYLVRTQEKFQ